MPRAGDAPAARAHVERCTAAMRGYLDACTSGDWARARGLNRELARLGVNVYLGKKFPMHRTGGISHEG